MKYEVIKSARKSISLQITDDGRLVVRAPKRASDRYIANFVNSKRDWIDKNLPSVLARAASLPPKFTDAEIERFRAEAKRLIPPRVAYFAEIMGVKYGKITVKKLTSRWGSCSSKDNLNFNLLLAACPFTVRDYVIIHELAHLIELNHSSRFWAIVARYCPNYRESRQWLETNGNTLVQRIKE